MKGERHVVQLALEGKVIMAEGLAYATGTDVRRRLDFVEADIFSGGGMQIPLGHSGANKRGTVY